MSNENDDDKEKKLKTVKELLSGLTPREIEVLKKRFGVELEDHPDIKEIGNQFDLTRTRIKEIENRALKKLSESDNRKQSSLKQEFEKCSFCGLALSDSVIHLKGKSGANICAGCLETCGKLLENDDPETS